MEDTNIVKFLELDSFVNDNFDRLSNEDYEYLMKLMQQLIELIHYTRK